MKEKDYRLFEKKLKEVSLLESKINYLSSVGRDLEEIGRYKRILSGYVYALRTLNDLEYKIVKGMYFDHKSLLQISREVNYSYCYCSRTKVRAVKKLMYVMAFGESSAEGL